VHNSAPISLPATRSGSRNLTRSLRENATRLLGVGGTRHFLYSLADFYLASAYGCVANLSSLKGRKMLRGATERKNFHLIHGKKLNEQHKLFVVPAEAGIQVNYGSGSPPSRG